MQFCQKCGVSVNGSKKCCPLCQHRLSGEPEPQNERYPVIPPPKYSRNLVFRIMTFAVIAICVISYVINELVNPDVKWCAVVCLAALCAWAAGTVAIWYRKRILKNIIWELLLITPICIAWDVNTGWHRWSVNFVLPILCGSAVIAAIIISLVMKYKPQEYLIYVFLEAIYGIVPFILVTRRIVTVELPSLICSSLSVLSIFSMLLFMGRNTGTEVKKKFHL